MKRFLINISLFISFLIIPTALIVVGNIFIINSSTYWELPNNEEYIVLGHSHPECAFNDSLIPNFVNLGLSGEAYLYTYIKLKKVIETNIQLKTVFIEFGTNNINKIMDSWTWDDKHISYNLPKYYSIIDQPEMKILCNENLKSILSISPKCYIREIGHTYYNLMFNGEKMISKERRYGGYHHLIRYKTDSLIVAYKSKKHTNNEKNTNISKINVYYLKKILELCQKNEIESYLIRSPVHELYSDIQEEKAFKNILVHEFPDAEFLDFARFPLKNIEFGDFGHLNYKGAIIFSKWFAKMLNNNLLEKKNKQAFINKEIEARTHNN